MLVARVALVLTLLGWAAACGRDDRGRKERTAALAGCADALERAAGLAAGEQLDGVARGCPAACPGLTGWLTARAPDRIQVRADGDPAVPEARAALVSLVEGCYRGCDVAAAVTAVPAPMVWPALLDACGPEGFGIPADQRHLGSEAWLVLHAVSRWIDRTVRAGVSDPQVPGRLEHVTGRGTFALPPPAHPGLPSSRFRRPPRARQFVLLEDDLRVGAVAHARLRNGRVELIAVPGGHPGQRVDVDQLGAVLAEHAELLGQLDRPVTTAPLLIAEATAPLARLFDALTRLGVDTAELAVAGDVTLAHPVVLERQGMGFGTPELQVSAAGLTIRGFGDNRLTTWAGLDAELDHFAAVNAPVRALELHPDPTATVADLVRVLDACVGARISALIFVPSPA